MKEKSFLVENLSAKDRVNLAIDQVNGLTREIAAQMGNQWERDRFGKYKFDPSRKPIAIKYDFMKRE